MEQTTPFISIIVPVYKVEKYLPACIDSILAQTFENFELILVDDGSPDNCGKICDKYAQTDNRIKVIHQKNGGVTKARATGVKQATGEFISFVDSDDTIPSDALEFLTSCITPNIDIIIGKITVDENFPLNNSIENSTALIDIDIYRKMQLLQTYIYQSGPCAKLFRQSLFSEKITEIPREIVMGEDWLMNIQLSFQTNNKVCFLNKIVYNYIKHATSITENFKSDMNYENRFFKFYMNSIPFQERGNYLETTIKKRIQKFLECTGYKYKLSNDTEPFLSILKNDIKETKYKIFYFTRFLIYIKNPILRFLLITIRKIFNKMGINLVTI